MSAFCKGRHSWKTPEIGDDALECENCSRKLDYFTEMTPRLRSSIINANDDERPDFREKFYAAQDDCRRRKMGA